MVVLLKRRKKTVSELAEEVKRDTFSPPKKETDVRWDQTISTGSTLLDLIISGGRNREGRIPGGILVEIYGPAGSGKTAVLSEICASVQANGGQVTFLDPEARLDQEYSHIYGVELDKKDYHRPNTVTEMFDYIWGWEPERSDVINGIGTDSLAALSTRLEMEDADKMGMRRAKEFSEGLRKTARIIRNNNWLVVCTNQVRESPYGETTPGGKGVPFYSSLRIKVKEEGKIEREIPVHGKKFKKVMGIKSSCYVSKSTVDDPYRSAYIYIVFGYGIDDIRGNLQYLKDMTKGTKYLEFFEGGFVSMERAIRAVEKNNLQKELKERVIDLWHEIEEKFKVERPKKERK